MTENLATDKPTCVATVATNARLPITIERPIMLSSSQPPGS